MVLWGFEIVKCKSVYLPVSVDYGLANPLVHLSPVALRAKILTVCPKRKLLPQLSAQVGSQLTFPNVENEVWSQYITEKDQAC